MSHQPEHARLSCPSLSPCVFSNLCPLSQWCHPTISSSVNPSPPALSLSQHQVFFPMRWFFASGSQCIRASASASVLPLNFQGWFPLGLTGLIFLPSKGLSTVFSSTPDQKHQFFRTQPSLRSNSHIHTWLLGKPSLWLYGPLLTMWWLCFLICCLGWS